MPRQKAPLKEVFLSDKDFIYLQMLEEKNGKKMRSFEEPKGGDYLGKESRGEMQESKVMTRSNIYA